MSAIDIKNDLKLFVNKYLENNSAATLLQAVSKAAEVELHNILLHRRIHDDVFELFEKDDCGRVKGEGKRLCNLCRIISHRSSKTCAQVFTESVILFADSNNSKCDLGEENDIVLEISAAKKSLKRSVSQTSSLKQDMIHLYYTYDELVVGSHERETHVSVLESPCKTINLTISMSRGAGGFDKCTLVDFQLLTCGFSPSESQVHIGSQFQGEDDCSAGASVDSGSADSEMAQSHARSDDGSQSAEEGAAEHDTSDYFSVSVDRGALMKLCDWLSFGEVVAAKRSKGGKGGNEEQEEDSAEQRQRFYEEHQGCTDMLMFLLSLPPVDDAWGIHTLILVGLLGSALTIHSHSLITHETGEQGDEECSGTEDDDSD